MQWIISHLYYNIWHLDFQEILLQIVNYLQRLNIFRHVYKWQCLILCLKLYVTLYAQNVAVKCMYYLNNCWVSTRIPNNAILNRFTSAFCLATKISYCVVGKRRKCSKYNQNMNILKFSSLFLLLKNIKRPICFFNISIRTIIIHNLTSE